MGATWTEFYKGRVLSKGYRDYAKMKKLGAPKSVNSSTTGGSKE